MKTRNPVIFVIRLLSLAIVITVAAQLVAQPTGRTTETRTEDEPIRLEVYEVTSPLASPFRADAASSAMKTNTPILETPVSISVITQELMAEQQVSQFGDALKNVASLTRITSFLGGFEQFNARGFLISNDFNYLRNGRLYIHFASPPMETLERIEVVKGPASVLFGQGSPGATVNMITKQPTTVRTFSAKATLGSDSFYRTHVDFGGPLTKGQSLSYRTNLSWQDSRSFRDDVFVKRRVAATALKWLPSDRVNVLFNLDWIEDERPQDTGLVAIGTRVAPLPIDRAINLPWGRFNSGIWNAGLNAEVSLNPDWKLFAGFNFQDFDRHRFDQGLQNLNEVTGNIRIQTRERINLRRYYTYNVDIVGRKATGALDHTLLLGANYIKADFKDTETVTPVFFNTNIFAPDRSFARPLFTLFPQPIVNRQRTHGAYAQDQVAIGESWRLVGGVRYDRYETTTENRNNNNPRSRNETENFTPRVGLIFKPSPSLATYISFTESFEPNGIASQGSNLGQQLDPTIGEQLEIGLKKDYFQGRLGLTFAAFRIAREGDPFFDAVQNLTVQRGKRVHQGMEADLAGQLTPNWQASISAMYLDGEIVTSSVPGQIGRRPSNVPLLSFSFWNSYKFTQGPLEGLSVGSGIFYKGRMPGDDNNSFFVEAYTRVDASLSYHTKLGKFKAVYRLNVENLFDERYFYGRSRLEVQPGAPLGIKLAADLSF